VSIKTVKSRLGRTAAGAIAGALLAALALAFPGCASARAAVAFEASLRERRAELEGRPPSTGRIHLFGESHGTDVGHQYWSTGARFLAHLRECGQESGEAYLLALENIEQGRMYYDYRMNVSARADMMAVNFIRAFDALGGESVMSAFYGAQHVAFGRYSRRGGRGATLATQLRARYGDSLSATLLRDIVGSSD